MLSPIRRPAVPLTSPKTVPVAKHIKVISPPAGYPVTLDEAKAFLRVTWATEDALIDGLIEAATDQIERYIRRALINRTYTQTTDTFFGNRELPDWEGVVQMPIAAFSTGVIELWYPPLVSVEEVRGIAEDGTPTVFPSTNYVVDMSTPDIYGRLALQPGAALPADLRYVNSMEVDYIAGYGANPEDVPQSIRQGILRLINYLYNNRGDCSSDGGDPISASGAEGFVNRYRVERMRN